MQRVLIDDDDANDHDVLEVVSVTDTLVRARTPYRFEIGEELRLRIEPDSAATAKAREVTARVRAHDSEDVTDFDIIARA